MIKTKIKLSGKLPQWLAIAAISLTAAGCVPFSNNQSAGVFKTTNSGTDWQAANVIKDNAGSLAQASVAVIAFDPKNEERLFMASYTDGLYKSENSGQTWERILSKIDVYDVAISPADSNVIYAAGFFADHGKLLVTRDGGKSWVEIYNEASSQNAVRSVALNPGNPSEVVIGMNSGNVIQSSDGGTNWRVLKNFDDRVNRIIFVDNSLFVMLRSKGLMRSTDGGLNFLSLTNSLGSNATGENFYESLLPTGSFAQMAISRNNPNVIYVTAESGMYKTSNQGQQWIQLPVPVKNNEVPFKAVTLDPNDENTVYAGAGTTIYKSSDAGQTFQTQSVAAVGFVNYILVNPRARQIIYSGIFAQ